VDNIFEPYLPKHMYVNWRAKLFSAVILCFCGWLLHGLILTPSLYSINDMQQVLRKSTKGTIGPENQTFTSQMQLYETLPLNFHLQDLWWLTFSLGICDYTNVKQALLIPIWHPPFLIQDFWLPDIWQCKDMQVAVALNIIALKKFTTTAISSFSRSFTTETEKKLLHCTTDTNEHLPER